MTIEGDKKEIEDGWETKPNRKKKEEKCGRKQVEIEIMQIDETKGKLLNR